jgi:2-oxoglutarate dehydrogenase E1 component
MIWYDSQVDCQPNNPNSRLQITPHLDKYPNASLLWCQVSRILLVLGHVCNDPWFLLQEEPMNNGAWNYVGPRIYTATTQTEHHKGKYPYYAGRGPTSSVATGSKVSSN